MSKHTKSKLELFYQDGKLYLECDAPQGKVRIAEMSMGHRTDSIQDAEHIKFCWNSCDTLTKQRDDLLAACEALVKAGKYFSSTNETTAKFTAKMLGIIIPLARAAIAKSEVLAEVI